MARRARADTSTRGWTCPDCGRRFDRANQSHGCAPARPLDEAFAERPDLVPIHQAVVRMLMKIGDVRAEAVEIGVLFKKTRTFAELRPRRDRLVLAFIVSRELEHPRVTKTLRVSAGRVVHYCDLPNKRAVDRDVKNWLAESYFSSPE